MDSAKIFIDTDNEITFILEKVLASKSEKVCLVVPDRAAIFTSISGLKLVKRIVDKSNKLLVVVTLDENGAALAKRAGLFVVSRVGEIDDEMWEKIQKSKFEAIKKDKKKVFYVPENKVKELEKEPEKKEDLSINQVLEKTFEEGDSNLVVGDVEEMPAEEIKEREVTQVRIKIDNEAIKPKEEIKLQEIKEEPKVEPQIEKVLPTEEKQTEVLNEKMQEAFEKNEHANIRQRRASPTSNHKLSFNEGSESKSQKKNSSLSEIAVPVLSSVNIEAAKAKVAAVSIGAVEWGRKMSKQISKKLKQVDIKRPITPGTKEIPLGSDRFSSTPKNRVPTRNITNDFGATSKPSLRPKANTGTGFASKFQLPAIKLEGRKKVIFYISSLIVVPILVILLGVYMFLNSMSLYTVNIRYKYLNVVDSRQIVASETGESGFRIVKLSETDSTSTSANSTGQKIVGDKASGFISVFNATAEVKVLKKGTAVTCISTACNGLIYYTDSDLNLGPGSSANDLRVVAGDIGENYNLSINAGRFKVANFNSNTEIIASNVQAIGGGTPKQTLKVISAEDIKSVEEKALADLKITLLGKIKNNPNNSNKYIYSDSTFVAQKTASQTDAEGTQADIVNTNVSAKGTIDAFSKDQIQPVVDEMKSKLAPAGYYLDEKQFNFTADQMPSEPGKITLKIQVNGIARVNFDIEKIKADLKGKSITAADQYISKLSNIEGYTSTYSPSTMPSWLRSVPGDPEKIEIKLIAEAPE